MLHRVQIGESNHVRDNYRCSMECSNSNLMYEPSCTERTCIQDNANILQADLKPYTYLLIMVLRSRANKGHFT